jgi:nicotinamide riboside kinase
VSGNLTKKDLPLVMAVRKFRCFSGPNGSGKSTLINEINRNFNLGITVNADVIEYELNLRGFLQLDDFSNRQITNKNWQDFLNSYVEVDKRISTSDMSIISINQGFLISEKLVNSYQAAILASFIREILLNSNKSFSFET